MDQSSKPTLIDALNISISRDRLATYLMAVGHVDVERALRLYLWNASIGEAFHLPIQGVEVGLRNCINKALCAEFGPNWWDNTRFLSVSDPERISDISTAKRRIINRGYAVSTAQIVATLSFGFWVALLQPRYNPNVWTKHIRLAFPYLPDDKVRADLAEAAKKVADLRNRIWHHEPIFRLNHSDEFRNAMILLKWICPAKEEWIRAHCRVMQVLRTKP